MEKEITITQALVELKTLDSRINKAITMVTPVAIKRPESKEADLEKFHNNAKSALDSAMGLIQRRNAIKSAIVLSNAKTKVSINGVEMTVAEAIERKSSIDYDNALLQRLAMQFAHTQKELDTINNKALKEIDEQLKVLLGTQGSDPEKAAVFRKTAMDNNLSTLFDPLNAETMIVTMSNDIEKFKADVDVALSISNAVTKITV